MAMNMEHLEKRARQFEKASSSVHGVFATLFVSNEFLFFAAPDKTFLEYPDNYGAIVFHVIVLIWVVLGCISLIYHFAAKYVGKKRRSKIVDFIATSMTNCSWTVLFVHLMRQSV